MVPLHLKKKERKKAPGFIEVNYMNPVTTQSVSGTTGHSNP